MEEYLHVYVFSARKECHRFQCLSVFLCTYMYVVIHSSHSSITNGGQGWVPNRSTVYSWWIVSPKLNGFWNMPIQQYIHHLLSSITHGGSHAAIHHLNTTHELLVMMGWVSMKFSMVVEHACRGSGVHTASMAWLGSTRRCLHRYRKQLH